jgi:hypothetical protein
MIHTGFDGFFPAIGGAASTRTKKPERRVPLRPGSRTGRGGPQGSTIASGAQPTRSWPAFAAPGAEG